MPQFIVLVARKVVQSGRVVVEAPSAMDAERMVATTSQGDASFVTWANELAPDEYGIYVTGVQEGTPELLAEPVIGDFYREFGMGDDVSYTLAQFVDAFDFEVPDAVDIIRSLLTKGEYALSDIQQLTCLDADKLRQQIADMVADMTDQDTDREQWAQLLQPEETTAPP
ncbi:MAG: hypothetical protein M1272_07830 [Firmicutes bacterium]|nr:hypothetical protein [Bacillota bacterium]